MVARASGQPVVTHDVPIVSSTVAPGRLKLLQGRGQRQTGRRGGLHECGERRRATCRPPQAQPATRSLARPNVGTLRPSPGPPLSRASVSTLHSHHRRGDSHILRGYMHACLSRPDALLDRRQQLRRGDQLAHAVGLGLVEGVPLLGPSVQRVDVELGAAWPYVPRHAGCRAVGLVV